MSGSLLAPAGKAKQDVDAFEKQALETYKVDLTAVLSHELLQPHLGGRYAAGYYAYLGA